MIDLFFDVKGMGLNRLSFRLEMCQTVYGRIFGSYRTDLAGIC
jgi:hypothetical protein